MRTTFTALVSASLVVPLNGCFGGVYLGNRGEPGRDAAQNTDGGSGLDSSSPLDRLPPPVDSRSPLDVTPPADSSGGDVSTACVPPPSGIVSWWRGEGNAVDAVGPNSGKAVGSVTYGPGMVGEAFHFDGSSYVIASATGLPLRSTDRTIELWARFAASYDAQAALFAGYGRWGTSDGTNEMLVSGSSCVGGAPANSLQFSQWGGCLADPTATTMSTWVYFALTLLAGTSTVYVNGNSVAASSSLRIDTPRGTVYMGGDPSAPLGPEWLIGDVDEVTVYNRALTAAEIASLYAAGSAGKCP